MRLTVLRGLTVLAALSLSTTGLAATATAAPAPLTARAAPVRASAAPTGVSTTGAAHRLVRVCATAHPGSAGCMAVRRDTVTSTGAVSPQTVSRAVTPSGYGPGDIRAAYALGSASSTRTVAIVDAYDDPNAAADLTTYRAQYGLPACTTASGCFRKVGQTGGAVPKANGGWAQEISLDLDMVSAACPTCKILLVEASSASFADLGAAVDHAAGQSGVAAISNSYGGSDSSATSAYDHPGIAITASTGDAGYGVQSPASFPTVVAVGGTSLTKTSTGWSESAWSGAGSGCSTINTRPSWQTSVTACSHKANADVSAVADPNTGVAVYDSYAYQGVRGWLVFGGTSASSPIIASIYAQGPTAGSYPAAYTWAHTSALRDVTAGSNGNCSTAVWCNARSGWDGPTGLGTPQGTSAF